MTIKNKTAYVDALWDWGFLDECFGKSKIRVSDVDGIVERNGHVLFIEAKPPGKALSVGQSILFGALANSGFSVLVIWGEPNKPETALLWTPYVQMPGKKFAADSAIIYEIVRRWFVCVNQIPHKSKIDKKRKWPITLDLKPDIV